MLLRAVVDVLTALVSLFTPEREGTGESEGPCYCQPWLLLSALVIAAGSGGGVADINRQLPRCCSSGIAAGSGDVVACSGCAMLCGGVVDMDGTCAWY